MIIFREINFENLMRKRVGLVAALVCIAGLRREREGLSK